jgi:hypothetical protein
MSYSRRIKKFLLMFIGFFAVSFVATVLFIYFFVWINRAEKGFIEFLTPSVIPISLLVSLLLSFLISPPLVRSHPPASSAPVPTAPPSTVRGNAVARLEKFKELLDKNLISKEDYEKKKAETLSQL